MRQDSRLDLSYLMHDLSPEVELVMTMWAEHLRLPSQRSCFSGRLLL